MSNPNPAGKRFQKGNKAATANKGKKHLKTKIREALKWEDAEGLLEKIIVDALNSKSPAVRRKSAKDFGEFIKPKKREQKIDGKLTIDDIIIKK